MVEHILLSIVTVIVLGIGAQWLAWRFKLPSILLLLTFGFLAGPVTKFLNPASLQGDWVFAFVSLSIGVILFEGGLSLKLSELREVGKAVRNLISIGVLVTWVLASLGGFYLLGFNWEISILLGAILTVTGPTVVTPLLRMVRPTGRVGAVAKWEGITIDPIGAILAVLVFEAIMLLNQGQHAGGFGEALQHAAEGLLMTIVTAVGISVLGAGLLILILRRRLVPDYLQSSFALMVVVGTFGISNWVQEESGLLEATLLGIMMANQKYVPVRRISEFKEDLQVLLLGSLFIVLSARLNLSALDYLDGRAFLFLALLVLLVRPLAVLLSSMGTALDWREQAFMSWLAPRGIVAAAVASLFAFRLEPVFPAQAEGIVPVVFLIIVGTVAIYGLTIKPLANYLGLAEPHAQGLLLLGAHPWAQQLGKALQKLGFKVLLIDTNPRNVKRARQTGLKAEVANALAEEVIDDLDLAGIGRLLALTPNDEANSLAALNFSEFFESNEIYQLAARPDSRQERDGELPQHLRGLPLFGEGITHLELTERFNDGDEIEVFELNAELTYNDLQERYEEEAILLFVVRSKNDLIVNSTHARVSPQSGDRVVMLVPASGSFETEAEETPFERLVTHAHVIDIKEEVDYHDVIRQAADLLAEDLEINRAELEHGLLAGLRYGPMAIKRGAALPHHRITGIEQPRMVLVRCQSGTCVDLEKDVKMDASNTRTQQIYALFVLVSDEDEPGEHLRILANIASRIDDESFVGEWRTAEDEQRLKETLLREERYFGLRINEKTRTGEFVGDAVGEMNLPEGLFVALLQRDGQTCIPAKDQELQDGDRLTIIGEPAAIQKLYNRYGEL